MEAINKVCANVAQDFSEEEKATARANIGVMSSSDVSSAITTAVNALDYQDTAVTHQFVTEVDETDGVISVTRAQASTSDIAGLPDALAAKQDALTTGPNIDIYNNIISTEKSKVSAGSNVSVSSSLDNVNRVVTYTVSATDTTYTAGSNITIDSNNVISASASPQVNTDWEASSGVAELINKPNLAYKYASDTATAQLKGIQYGQNSNGDWHHQIIINNGAMQSVGWGVPTRPSASANLALTTDSNGKMQWTAKPGQRITFTSSEATPYTRVSDIITEGNIPVYMSSGQGATRYYELIYSSSAYYTFACSDTTPFGPKTYYVQVNSDNTITTGDMTSQTPLSFESPWLTNDNGTIKAKWPYGTCIGTINDRAGHTVTWTHGMTTTQFNQKLIDLPLPAAGLYVLYVNGNGKYSDPSGSTTSSQLLRFRVCNGYNTVAINTIDGLAQIPLSTNNLGFSCQLLVAAGSTPLDTLTLNVSNDDYEPASGQSHTLTIQYLNVIWVRYPM